MTSETEQLAWVETWARRIENLGLSPMAIPLLEVAHTFGFLGSQALLLIQPLMAGIVDDATLEQTIALLDSPELQDRLRAFLKGEEN